MGKEESTIKDSRDGAILEDLFEGQEIGRGEYWFKTNSHKDSLPIPAGDKVSWYIS
ncbi:MAG: hypothetical protein ACD_71C00073G0004, partial [uncultured bacterium (gcode 4)]